MTKKKDALRHGTMLVENEELIIDDISLDNGHFKLRARGVCSTAHQSGLVGIVILDNAGGIVYSDPEYVIPLSGGINEGDTLDLDYSLSPYALPGKSNWVLAK